MYMHFSFSKSSETYQYQFDYIKIQLGRLMYCQIRLGESLVLQASRQMLGLYVRNPFWDAAQSSLETGKKIHLQICVTDVRHIGDADFHISNDPYRWRILLKGVSNDPHRWHIPSKRVSNNPSSVTCFSKTCLQWSFIGDMFWQRISNDELRKIENENWHQIGPTISNEITGINVSFIDDTFWQHISKKIIGIKVSNGES